MAERSLILVATPIGNARDITLRALEALRDADVLAAEDTRSLRRLMDLHGVPLSGRRMIAYHDHSSDRDRARILEHLKQGESVVYASEAGTPLIADPGYALVDAAREAVGKVVGVATVEANHETDLGLIHLDEGQDRYATSPGLRDALHSVGKDIIGEDDIP